VLATCMGGGEMVQTLVHITCLTNIHRVIPSNSLSLCVIFVFFISSRVKIVIKEIAVNRVHNRERLRG